MKFLFLALAIGSSINAMDDQLARRSAEYSRMRGRIAEGQFRQLSSKLEALDDGVKEVIYRTLFSKLYELCEVEWPQQEFDLGNLHDAQVRNLVIPPNQQKREEIIEFLRTIAFKLDNAPSEN